MIDPDAYYREFYGGPVPSEDFFPAHSPDWVPAASGSDYPSPPGFECPAPAAGPRPPVAEGSLGDFSPANMAGCARPLDVVLKSGALEAFRESKRREALAAAGSVTSLSPAPGGPNPPATVAAGPTAPDVPGANAAVVEAVRARADLLASLLPVVPPEAAAQIAAAVPPRRHMRSKPMDLGAFPKPLPEKDNPRALFRNGWLRKGGGAFLIAPAGVGKSVLTIQCAISWALGRECFGIQPVRDLFILIIQAEDDCDEVAEFRDSVSGGLIGEYGFSREDIDLALGADGRGFGRVKMIKGVGLTGQEFVDEVGAILDDMPQVDLIMVNPFQSYFGGDCSKNVELSRFFRSWLDREIKDPGDEGKDRAAVMFVHHTNKPPSKDDERIGWGVDMFASYIGAGGAEIVNWARAILSLMPTKVYGLFRLCAGKRGQKLGWTDAIGNKVHTKMIKYAEDGRVYWRPTDEEDMAKLALEEGPKKGARGAVGGDGSGGVPPAKARTSVVSVLTVVSYVSAHPGLSENGYRKDIAEMTGGTSSTIRRRLEDACENGLLTFDKDDASKKYSVTEAGEKFINEPVNF